MALGIVPNGIKIELNAIQNGIPVVNRFYVTQTGTVGSADLDDTIAAALGLFNDLRVRQHQSYVLQNITATDVSVENGTQTILPMVTNNTGQVLTAAATANAAICVSLRTNLTGRSFRGRFYVGGLPNELFLNAQNILTEAAAGFAAAFEDFIDALNAIDKTLVVVSNYASGIVRIVALATEIISIIVDTKIDSQRRRTAN